MLACHFVLRELRGPSKTLAFEDPELSPAQASALAPFCMVQYIPALELSLHHQHTVHTSLTSQAFPAHRAEQMVRSTYFTLTSEKAFTRIMCA